MNSDLGVAQSQTQMWDESKEVEICVITPGYNSLCETGARGKPRMVRHKGMGLYRVEQVNSAAHTQNWGEVKNQMSVLSQKTRRKKEHAQRRF